MFSYWPHLVWLICLDHGVNTFRPTSVNYPRKLTPWSRVLPEKQIVTQLLTRDFLLFIEPVGSLPYSYDPITGPCPEPDESSSHLTFNFFTLHPEGKFLQPYFEEQLEISVFQLLVAWKYFLQRCYILIEILCTRTKYLTLLCVRSLWLQAFSRVKVTLEVSD